MDDKGKEGDGDFEASAFEALERDFQEILQELVGDKSLEHFRLEYEKLHRALKKSHESEKHLIKKCRELNQEIVTNAAKVQTALKLSQEDQATITALKKEIERAWKMVETSHEKEQRAKDTIQSLKTEISKLGRLVEQGAGLSINQENMVNQLVQEKNDVIKHRDMLQGQVVQLQQQNSDLTTRVARVERERQDGNQELVDIKQEFEDLVEDGERQQNRKEKLDKDLKDLRSKLESCQNEINAKKEEYTRNFDLLSSLDKKIKEEKAEVERLHSKREILEAQKDSTRKQYNEELANKGKVADENSDYLLQIKTKQDEHTMLRKGKARIDKGLDELKKTKAQNDADNAKLEATNRALRGEIANLTKELGDLKKQSDQDSKDITDIMHERDILSKNVMTGDERTKTQIELVSRHEGQANTLEKDLKRWKARPSTPVRICSWVGEPGSPWRAHPAIRVRGARTCACLTLSHHP